LEYEELYSYGPKKIELVKYELDLDGVKKVSCDKNDTQLADDYAFLYVNRNDNHHLCLLFYDAFSI
jgi:hypothetical protein